MVDAGTVRPTQRIGNLRGKLQHLIERYRAFCNPRRKSFAFQVLEHHKIGAIVFADVEEDADVGMIQAGDHARLAFKARPQVFTRGDELRQHLNRDSAIQTRVARLKYFPHAAGADGRNDFIRAELRAGG